MRMQLDLGGGGGGGVSRWTFFIIDLSAGIELREGEDTMYSVITFCVCMNALGLL